MRRIVPCRVWLAMLAMAGMGISHAATKAVGSILESLPLSFEPNRGQSDPRVKFLARVSGYTLFITADEAVFAGRDGSVERMKLMGANRRMRVEPLDRQSGVSNYFLGNDRAKWRTNVPNYGHVALREVYPGIDLIFYGHQQQLEYDWVVQPGADPREIRVRWESGGEIRTTPSGDMVVGASLRQKKPAISQDGQPIEGGYVVHGREVGFLIAKYDATKTLVIDPVIEYTSYLGGLGASNGVAITTDPAGNIYVGGWTVANNFPGTVSYGHAPLTPQQTAFVSKFAPVAGGTTQLLFTAFLGDSNASEGLTLVSGIAIDSGGNIVIAGQTNATDFPIQNAVQSQFGGTMTCPRVDGTLDYCQNGFLAKFAPNGGSLIFCTYYGGSNASQFNGVALDSADGIYVIGQAAGPTVTGTPTAIQPNQSSVSDIQMVRFDPTGKLLYSTFLGGSSGQAGYSIAVEKPGVVWIGAATGSSDIPTTSNAFQTTYTGLEKSAYVARIDTTQSGKAGLTYATFYNGAGGGNSTVNDLFLDPSGQVVFCGAAFSQLPTTPTAMQPTEPGVLTTELSDSLVNADGYIARINPAVAGANGLTYGSFIGGTDLDWAQSCGLDPQGNFVVAGGTQSLVPFLTAGSPIPLKTIGTAPNVFVIRIDPTTAGGRLESMLFGGENNDQALAMAFDSKGYAYLTGVTYSNYFPVTAGALQTAYGGNNNALSSVACCGDGWVMQLNLNLYQVPVVGLVLHSGDSQAGAAGSTLPNPLLVQLADAKGNPLALSGYEITFTATGGVTLASGSTELTGGTGTAGVFVQLGASNGTVTASLNGTTATYTFHVYVGSAPVPHSVSIASGNNQSGPANALLPQPLVVQLLDANNNPLPLAGVNVLFTPTNASVAAVAVPTNASGQASTAVTLGSQAGSASVQATVSGVAAVTANFTVSGATGSALPAVTSISNDASGQAGIAPGGYVSIYGSNFASSGTLVTWSNSVVNGELPTTLAGVKVSIGGTPAYVEAVTPGQINILAPNVSAGLASVTVTTSAGASEPYSASVLAVQPAFFEWPGNYAVATDLSYNWVVKNGTFSVTTTPAQPGETIVLWGTGFGATTPAAPEGQVVPGQIYSISGVGVTVGDFAATVLSTALSPGSAGVYQVAIQVPSTLANGDYPVVVSVGGVQSPSGVNLTVQK